MFVTEFQRISNEKYFGRAEHPSRAAAERYATEQLIALGESAADAEQAAEAAGWMPADASAHGYAVRIFEEG